MSRRLVWQDLGWAVFILAVAGTFGLLQHWPLVRVSLTGGLLAHLEEVRTKSREVKFQGVKTVSLAQAYARFQQGDTLFLDARHPEEYADLHIPGALNLPPEKLADAGGQAVAKLAKDREIVVYCGQLSCDAALKVAEKLQSLGFPRVATFLGGFSAWDEAGYPVGTSK
jgi:rhodanese-related sulfurtransferase